MGSTKQATIYLTHVQDHPHIHGEHSRPAWRYRTTTGSPPYTWGAQPLNSPFSNWDKDHPHIHGEHPSANRLHDRPSGSPPYTWGALGWLQSRKTAERITPIYMGSTLVNVVLQVCPRDHPHIHGEHTQSKIVLSTMTGSPPYTWGAPLEVCMEFYRPGITPIYMGSTGTSSGTRLGCRDHPHIHGEHQNQTSVDRWGLGSPPYTWGALVSAIPVSEISRITPIYMGSTQR